MKTRLLTTEKETALSIAVTRERTANVGDEENAGGENLGHGLEFGQLDGLGSRSSGLFVL